MQRQVWLSLLRGHCSFLLGPGAHKILLCPPKVCFLKGAQSVFWIPRLGNLLWALELLQKCENFFGRIFLQFVGHFLGFPDSSVGKESACNAGDPSLIPGTGRSAGERDRLPASIFLGFPCSSAGKEFACSVGDLSSIPRLGRSPGEGEGSLLQYSSLENSMNCIVHGVTKSLTP